MLKERAIGQEALTPRAEDMTSADDP